MFLIPNWLINFISFPGTVVHETAHEFFCWLFGVRVKRVVYFQKGSVAGFVEHDVPESVFKLFWISSGPLIINSLLVVILAHLAFTAGASWQKLIALFLAFAIGLQAFPSSADAKNILKQSREHLKRGGSIFNYFAYPFFGLIWLANFLKYFWFDVFFSILLIYLTGYYL